VGHKLAAITFAHDGDDLEQRAASAPPEVEPEVVIQFVDHHDVPDGVLNAVDGDTGLERRGEDIDTGQSYYETRGRRQAGRAMEQSSTLAERTRRRRMITLDIPADLNAEDETGFVWTFLDGAAEPDVIRAGAIVVAGSELTPAVCQVVDLVEKAVGTVVHLRVLPGSISQYRRLLGRIGV